MTEHDEPSSSLAVSSNVLCELAASARRGSAEARAEFIRRLSSSMECAIRAEFQGHRKEDVEDVLQSCRLELLLALERGDEIQNPRSFAYALGSNQTKKFLTKYGGHRHDRLKVQDLPPSLAWTRPATSSPEDTILPRQELEVLLPQLLPQLTDKEKRVFELHMKEGLGAPEIAKLLGIANNYVHQHVSQIRKKANRLRGTS